MKRVVIAFAVACGSKPVPPPKPVEKPPPSCVQAADHMLDLVTPPEQAKRVRDVFLRRCEVDAWPGDVRACIVSTTSLKDPKGCKSGLVIAHREALERDLDEAERAARVSTLGECERYKQRIEKLMTCDKLPQQSRDALKQGFEAMEQGWATMKDMPEEAQKAMQDGCKQGADAIEQAVGALCGW
jgi:hypothetical protein